MRHNQSLFTPYILFAISAVNAFMALTCMGIVGQGIELALIDLGKPWQNGTTENFNGKFREECLAMEWFRNRLETKVVIEDCGSITIRGVRIPARITTHQKRLAGKNRRLY